jgi:hypothetical protein
MKNVFLLLCKSSAIVILMLYSLHHSFALATESRREFKSPADPNSVAAFEKRFAPVKAQLALMGCKDVGYITDLPDSDPNWFMQFFRTQYALVPTLVDDSLKHQVIVADLRDSSSIAKILHDGGLSVVSDYGNGLFVLSRRAL